MTYHTFAFSSDNARTNRVSIPLPPFKIDMGARPETDPDPRITILEHPRPSTVKYRYTMIKKIMQEALGDESY